MKMTGEGRIVTDVAWNVWPVSSSMKCQHQRLKADWSRSETVPLYQCDCCGCPVEADELCENCK